MKMDRRTFLCAVVISAAGPLVVGGMSETAQADSVLPLVVGGQAKATVYLDASADAQTHDAAAEIVDYVQMITGATLPIISVANGQVPDDGQGKICIGMLVDGSGVTDQELSALGPDGYIIRRSDNTLTIAGKDSWGNRYGVYEFLEKYANVRWLMPDNVIDGQVGSDIPNFDDLAVGDVDTKQSPAVSSRIIYPFPVNDAAGQRPWQWNWTSSAAWIAGMTSSWAQYARVHDSLQFNHNMYTIIHIAKYSDPALTDTYHPEFFPIVDGQTVIPKSGSVAGWQPRFSADGIAAAAAEQVVAFLRANPDVISYSLSVNDGFGYSDDDVEQGVVNSRGFPSASESYYQFVNSVVEIVADQYPAAQCGVIAYDYVVDPPSFKLHQNVIPVLVLPTYRWLNDDVRTRDRQWVEQWSGVASKIGWWDRLYCEPYCLPHLCLGHLADSYRYLHSHNVVSVLAESGFGSPRTWGDGPKFPVFAQLLWDPGQDVDRMAHDWCAHVAGNRAAPFLQAYFRVWDEFWSDHAPRSEWFQANSFTLYSLMPDYLEVLAESDVAEARKHLADAAARAGTPEQAGRIEVIQRDFDFYEASALSYPKRTAYPASALGAISTFDDAAGKLDRNLSLGQQRLTMAATLYDYSPGGSVSHSPIAHGAVWTGWNLYPAWDVGGYIASQEPSGGPVRDHVVRLSNSGGSANVKTLAQMVLSVADGDTVDVGANMSFEDATRAPWTVTAQSTSQAPAADVLISGDAAFTGAQSLRVPAGFIGRIGQRIAVGPGFLRFQAQLHIRTEDVPGVPAQIGNGHYAQLQALLSDANGQQLQAITRTFSLERAIGGWYEVAITDFVSDEVVSAVCWITIDTGSVTYLDDVRVIQLSD